jgi:hypothetical protein
MNDGRSRLVPILKTCFRGRVLKIATYLFLLCTVAIGSLIAFHRHDLDYPSCVGCDASEYGVMALGIKKLGIFGPWNGNNVRTYGYPLFISFVLTEHDLTQTMAGYFTSKLAVVQSLLYIATCLCLFFVIHQKSPAMAWCCALGLLLNPFVLNYIPLRLTEGLNATILVSLTVIVCALSLNKMRLLQLYALILIGSLIAGFAMAVRPANFVVVAAWLGFLIFYTYDTGGRPSILSMVAIIGLAIPILPQSLINALHYGTLKPLPVIDLGSIHLKLGFLALKYETNLSGIGPLQLFYQNVFTEQINKSDFGWQTYFWYPQYGIATLLAHVFNSLNHSYFFTYVYDIRPSYYSLVIALNHLMLFAAAGSVALFLRRRLKGSLQTEDGIAVFLSLIALFTLGLNSISLPETRFGLAVFVMGGPLAVWGIYNWSLAGFKRKVVIITLCVLYVLAGRSISDWMLARDICNVDGNDCKPLIIPK